MKNNLGFTLIELLAVIVILAIIITIAVPSTLTISKKIKQNMFCSKIDTIETAAKLYGEDYRDSFHNISVDSKTVKGETITVKNLVDKYYLKKDKNTETGTYGSIVDPRNQDAYLDGYQLSVYIKYDRVYVKFNNSDANACKS